MLWGWVGVDGVDRVDGFEGVGVRRGCRTGVHQRVMRGGLGGAACLANKDAQSTSQATSSQSETNNTITPQASRRKPNQPPTPH